MGIAAGIAYITVGRVFIADAKDKGPSKKKAEARSDDSGKDCLIVSKPDLFQPMDKHESGWQMSNWPNRGVFNCTWSPRNVSFANGIMFLALTKGTGEYPYNSGEYRTVEEKFGFGMYEARMKASRGTGLVAGTFFTYSGTWGQKDHNEIDFEVLGKNPTIVQLNYFYAGSGAKSENEKLVNMGFDASLGFHNYGFVWKQDAVEWYIDGKLVHKVTANVPQDPCRIMVNFWPGTSEVRGWLGGVYNGSGAKVEYDWIKYSSLSDQPSGPSGDKGTTAPVEIEAVRSEEGKSTKGPIYQLVSVARTGAGGDDGSPRVEITLKLKNLPSGAAELKGFIRTNQDWPAGSAYVGDGTSGEFSFYAYLSRGNSNSPFYVQILDTEGKVIGRIPERENEMIVIPFPKK